VVYLLHYVPHRTSGAFHTHDGTAGCREKPCPA